MLYVFILQISRLYVDLHSDFNETKIALAIKKAFDEIIEINEYDEEAPKYSEKDMQKVLHDVLDRIKKEYVGKEKIKIEENIFKQKMNNKFKEKKIFQNC